MTWYSNVYEGSRVSDCDWQEAVVNAYHSFCDSFILSLLQHRVILLSWQEKNVAYTLLTREELVFNVGTL